MEQKVLLVTGFEPFHGQGVNPSWEAALRLPQTLGPWRLEALRLPVVFGKAGEMALARARELNAAAVLALGQAGGRDALTPEVVAINLRRASIPDNEGQQPQGCPVIPGGADGYFSTLPVEDMAAAAGRAGVPSRLSYTAGTYVCNDLFYQLLHCFRGSPVRAGFVHVPFVPGQEGPGQPTLPLEQICAGLEAMVLAMGQALFP